VFAFLNFVGRKLNDWLGPSSWGRMLSAVLAVLLVAFSLWYGYARYVQREEALEALQDKKSAIELHQAIEDGSRQ
jgi:hypothetical protein